MDPKEAKRQRLKAAAPLLGAAGCRDHIFSPQVVLGQDFDNLFDYLERPGNLLLTIFRGSCGMVDF